MKRFLLFIIVLSFTNFYAVAQQNFYSEGDVFQYLSTNSFSNSEVDVTITFSDMGAYLNVNGNMKAFNPEISIRNSKTVILRYYLMDNYNSNLTFLLDGNTGALIDANNRRVYSKVELGW